MDASRTNVPSQGTLSPIFGWVYSKYDATVTG
ncbi:hypothetical protein FPSE_09132 [Fusarium pseudograminearum CS3096]|uniref:Uncharacterized protein n=1 Tax=Fusarium pseudograminearum (strain CS3096) TaxID=1028729 RepID=K3VA33_FUSPC|nr:hypothetical protein FPSE_09132 [Fusarium pseudograminearum CS3096]EKJ70622.1 hypothetical protein FPSE_09132 [Fusarium pseudograminearum CS3096]